MQISNSYNKDKYPFNMNLTIKNEEITSILKTTEFSIIVFSLMILLVSMCIDGKNMISIFAQSGEEIDSSFKKNEPKNNNNNNDLTTITVQIDKNNIIHSENSNDNLLKIIGYLNGEGQTKYIDLKEIDKGINQNEKFWKVDLEFNKNNDITSTMVDDEYYVCAYLIENSNITGDVINTIPLYDCDEGNIGTSTTIDSVTLFSTMKKYGASKAFYTTNQNTAAGISNPNEVKITINVPIYDARDIDDMNVVAMVRGEYQIKTIQVQNELEDGKNKDDQISVPFIFDRQTEVGPIQIGDLFFGCATSDEFPDQNSDCEKKMIKDLDKTSKICVRHDNSC
jgi:hypothetical protein